ncbi:hypothetical protein MKY42_11690 [Paenibacillus sp. FSL W7-1088]|uniref:hypothetical protein n=1 Tax=Paenibacillus sp. FSL W7-1088 TaxID=2921695 RepID=UPI0030EE50D9
MSLPVFESEDYKAYVIPAVEVGDNFGLRIFDSEEKVIVEMLISKTAVAVSSNDVTEENVYNYLWEWGKARADKKGSPVKLKIYQDNVNANKLVGSVEEIELLN